MVAGTPSTDTVGIGLEVGAVQGEGGPPSADPFFGLVLDTEGVDPRYVKASGMVTPLPSGLTTVIDTRPGVMAGAVRATILLAVTLETVHVSTRSARPRHSGTSCR